MIPTLPTAYTFRGVTVRVLDVQDGPVTEDNGNAGLTGELAGAVTPNSVTFCISFKTGLGGATNRGRNYVCGLLESEVTDNELSLTRANILRTSYTQAIGAGTVANGWIWSVISRKIIAPSPDGRCVPITNVTISDARIDTQRRRLPR
jgi:hypothetical protein